MRVLLLLLLFASLSNAHHSFSPIEILCNKQRTQEFYVDLIDIIINSQPGQAIPSIYSQATMVNTCNWNPNESLASHIHKLRNFAHGTHFDVLIDAMWIREWKFQIQLSFFLPGYTRQTYVYEFYPPTAADAQQFWRDFRLTRIWSECNPQYTV